MKTHPLLLGLMALPLLLAASGCDRKPAAKADSGPNPKIEAIRQAGYPVTLAELNEWYAEPPPTENAASLYGEAFGAIAAVEATSPAFLTKNQQALELLHQAVMLKHCRYPIDLSKGINAPLPHLAKLRKAAQLLSQNAKSQAGKGQMDLAAQSLLDGLSLARSVEDEPLILSRMIQFASERIIQTGLESILTRKTFSEGQMAVLQAAFREAELGISLVRPVAGERSLGIGAFQLPTQEQLQPMALSQQPPITMDFEAYRKTPVFSADFQFYLDLMEKGLAASALPFPKSLDTLSEWKSQMSEAQSKGYHVSALLLPAFESAFERAAECVGRLRIAQAALAVERYRLANNNAVPPALATLVPQFLAQVPADPFDGQPLRYNKTSSTAFVVYSIGQDRQDDGGFPKPPGATTDEGCDVTFAVNR